MKFSKIKRLLSRRKSDEITDDKFDSLIFQDPGDLCPSRKRKPFYRKYKSKTEKSQSSSLSGITMTYSYEANLNILPTEIFDMILQNLDNVSRTCLAMTNSRMRSSLTGQQKALSRCERWLLMCICERDQITPHPQSYACCLCKTKHPRKEFVQSINAQVFKERRIDNGRVKGDSITRYCWRREIRTSWEKRSFHSLDEKRWVQQMPLTCLHCFEEVEPGDLRVAGCSKCDCDICPRAGLPFYVRYGPRKWLQTHPKVACLFRTSAEELWIREDFRELSNHDPSSMANRIPRLVSFSIGLRISEAELKLGMHTRKNVNETSFAQGVQGVQRIRGIQSVQYPRYQHRSLCPTNFG